MKGFTHFMSGIAAATFIPEVVRMSTSSRLDTVEGAASSFILMLPGLFGLLPDALDFKLGQFYSIGDIEIDPDPRSPDPQKMAEAFAEGVRMAGESGKEVKVQFFPIQLGASLWRQYTIIFDEREVTVQINEIVKTSQVPVLGTAPKSNRVGRAPLEYALKTRTTDYDWLNKFIRAGRFKIKGPDAPPGPVKPSTVDILAGTQFALQRESDGRIFFNWLPWHRTWSHSYVLGAFLAIPVFLATWMLGLYHWWLYGAAAFLGFAVHITEDMTGHIGGSLFWPFHKPRAEGYELFKASDPRTNFSVNYTCIVLILWNVDRFSTQAITLPWWQYFGAFWLAPMILYFWLCGVIKARLRADSKNEVEEAEGVGELVVD